MAKNRQPPIATVNRPGHPETRPPLAAPPLRPSTRPGTPRPAAGDHGKYRWPGERAARHSRPFGAKYRDTTPATRVPGGEPSVGQGVKDALTPKQRKARDKWRQTSLVEGGSLTNYQAKKERNAQSRLEFGDLLRGQRQDVHQAQTARDDIGDYYDAYLKQLAEHSSQTQQFGQAASNQITGLQQGITGLAGADQAQLQGQANADAASRGTTAGDTSKLGDAATGIRQALVASFGTQQAGVNSARNNYADTMAKVVGPGQRLQAGLQATGRVRQAQQAVLDTRKDRGAFKAKLKGEQIASETDRVTAGAIANVDIQGKQADIKAKNASTAASKATTEKTKAATDYFLKHGYWPATGKPKAPKGTSVSDLVNEAKLKYFRKHGYWPPTGPPKDGKKKKNDDSTADPTLYPGTQGKAYSQVQQIQRALEHLAAGKKINDKDENPKKITDRQAQNHRIEQALGSKLMHPALLSAAQDAMHLGALTSATVERLRAYGVDPAEVARILGTRMPSKVVDANTNAYAHDRGLPPEVNHQ